MTAFRFSHLHLQFTGRHSPCPVRLKRGPASGSVNPMNALARYLKQLVVVSVALFSSSCGYRPLDANLPGGGRDIHVPTVKNQTPFPGLGAPLTSAIRRKSAASGLNVVNSGHGAPRIQATIVAAKQRPGMLRAEAGHLVPVDAIWSISVEATLVKADGETAVGPQLFEIKGRAYSGTTAQSEESLGHHRKEALLEEVADAIVDFMFLF